MADAPVDADAFNAFEATGWEKQAAGYEDFFGPITTRLVEPLLDAAEVCRGERVLDVASGPGYVAARAVERGASVIGMDVAEAMIALARRLHPQLDFRRGNVEARPFPDRSFDAVVGNFIMLHLGRPEGAASEFVRVLVPGGRLAVPVWDAPERARLLGVLVDAVAAVGASTPEEIPVGPPIFQFSDHEEFARLLRREELEDIRVRTISFSHPETSPDDLWQGLLGGTVRVGDHLPPNSRRAARDSRGLRPNRAGLLDRRPAGGSRVRQARVRPEVRGALPIGQSSSSARGWPAAHRSRSGGAGPEAPAPP
jgi:ubiquinone/menaquinone biosynthesis C-methylase UbiE